MTIDEAAANEKRERELRATIGVTELESLIEDEKQHALERALLRQEVFFKDARPKEQVNMRIAAHDAFRLEVLAEKFDHTRSSMAAALLRAALVDAWDYAELPPPFEEGTEMYDRLIAYLKDDEGTK